MTILSEQELPDETEPGTDSGSFGHPSYQGVPPLASSAHADFRCPAAARGIPRDAAKLLVGSIGCGLLARQGITCSRPLPVRSRPGPGQKPDFFCASKRLQGQPDSVGRDQDAEQAGDPLHERLVFGRHGVVPMLQMRRERIALLRRRAVQPADRLPAFGLRLEHVQ